MQICTAKSHKLATHTRARARAAEVAPLAPPILGSQPDWTAIPLSAQG